MHLIFHGSVGDIDARESLQNQRIDVTGMIRDLPIRAFEKFLHNFIWDRLASVAQGDHGQAVSEVVAETTNLSKSSEARIESRYQVMPMKVSRIPTKCQHGLDDEGQMGIGYARQVPILLIQKIFQGIFNGKTTSVFEFRQQGFGHMASQSEGCDQRARSIFP